MILGMKVRKQDLDDMLKFNPKILEFHFSDSDLNLELEGNFNQKLIVHCYEFFDRKLLDLANPEETNQIHSKEKTIELIQKAIDKTKILNKQFLGEPTIIIHPGGYSLNELEPNQIIKMKESLTNSIDKIDTKNVNFLLENMPPYAWFFGGRWNSNVFLSSEDMIEYCNNTGFRVCYDLCHSYLFCNKSNRSVIDELKNIKKYVDHFHLSDAEGVDGEGLQFGEGDLPFKDVLPILNDCKEKGFAVEVWRGHENGGKGFKEFLDRIKEEGLIIN